MNDMVDKKTWAEFRQCGLLWWVNMIIHTFGWAIVVDIDDSGNITDAHPARVKFRGFSDQDNANGYIKVSEYIADNAEQLKKEAKE